MRAMPRSLGIASMVDLSGSMSIDLACKHSATILKSTNNTARRILSRYGRLGMLRSIKYELRIFLSYHAASREF